MNRLKKLTILTLPILLITNLFKKTDYGTKISEIEKNNY